MDLFNLLFAILSMIVGGFCIVVGIMWIIAVHTFVSVLLSIYFFIFGLCIIAFEIFMPSLLQSWLTFYMRWLGKGLFFVYLGVIMLLPYEQTNGRDERPFYLVAGIFTIVVGCLYCLLQILAALSVHSHKQAQPIIHNESGDNKA
eukprot:m51a1_g4468 hypothetical protein (145) ;mRNA; r:232289-233038